MSTNQQPMMIPPSGYCQMAPAYPPSDRRTANLRVLGVFLLIAFALPVLRFKRTESGFTVAPYFLNVGDLAEPYEPPVLKFQLVYPAIAGVLLIILAPALRNYVRSVCIIVLGLIPVIALLASRAVSRAFHELAGSLVQLGSFPEAILGWLAFVWLYVGARARWYRPGSLAAYIVGAAGGGLYIIQLVLPVLPKELGSIPVVFAFKGLKWKEFLAGAVGSIIQMLYFVAAAIVCLANYPRKTPSVRSVAGRAFSLMVTGICFAVAGALGNVFYVTATAGGNVERLADLVEASGVVKSIVWFGAILLMIPFGLTDLIVWLSRATDVPQLLPAVMPPGIDGHARGDVPTGDHGLGDDAPGSGGSTRDGSPGGPAAGDGCGGACSWVPPRGPGTVALPGGQVPRLRVPAHACCFPATWVGRAFTP
jgi:hypothetical protein